MKKKLFVAIALSSLFMYSCGKDDKTPYEKEISGVNLTNELGTPVGSIGTPDVKSAVEGMNMFIYPTPCSGIMMVNVSSNKGMSHKITATLVNVTYDGAPKTWTNPGTGITMNANADNKDAAGTIALTQTKTVVIDTAKGGIQSLLENTNFQFDVASLPRGFYRVYIETDDGRQIWDNGWILR